MEENNRAKIARCGYAAFSFSGLCSTAAGILVTLLQQRYDLPYTLTGNFLSALSLGNLLAALVSGLLAGSWGVRRVALALSGGAALGYLLMSVTGVPMLLWMAFFILGIGKGSTANISSVLVAQGSSDRTRSMNLMNAGFALGALACPFIINAMSSKSLPWQAPFLAMVLMGILLWVSFWLAPTGKEMGRAQKGERSEWGFLRTGSFWRLTGLMFFEQASEVTITSFVVTYFIDAGLLPGRISGYVVTLLWACMLGARLVIARFGGRARSPFSLLSVMCVGTILTYLLMLMANGPTLALLGVALLGIAIAGMYPTGIAAAGDQLSSQSLGVLLPVAGSGAVIMPAVAGAVAESAGIRGGMACILVPLAGLLVMCLVCLYYSIRERKA